MATVEIVDRSFALGNWGPFAANSVGGVGQIFTARPGPLTQAELYADWASGSGPLEYRVLVVTNDGANGAFSPGQVLYRSSVRSLVADSPETISVSFGNLSLTTGGSYAILLDTFPSANSDNVSFKPVVSYVQGSGGTNYTGGNAVYFGGVEDSFLSGNWEQVPTYDLAFKLTFGSNAAPAHGIPSGGIGFVEDRFGPLTGLLVADADGDQLTTIITVTQGTLAGVGVQNGAALTFLTSSAVRLVGSAAQINNSLSGLRYGANPDFNGPASLVIATSDGSVTTPNVVTLNVAAANDAPTLMSEGAGTAALIGENRHATGLTFKPADIDAGTVFATNSFNLSGADAARFKVVAASGGTFALEFAEAPDFEAPRDAGRDNTYDVSVSVLDAVGGLGSAPLALSVTVADRGLPSSDYDGDGRADILWRQAGGAASVWAQDGAATTRYLQPGSLSPAWSIAATGDLDGNGATDLVWRHASTGETVAWYLADGAVASSVSFGAVDTSWRVLGSGDFDRDGDFDLLWQHADGRVITWNAAGQQLTAGAPLATLGAEWRFQATGDFDGDGTADILWRNAGDGSLNVWRMADGRPTGAQTIAQADVAWQVQAAADLDGDRDADLLWRHTADGSVAIWRMEDGRFAGASSLGAISADWTIADAQDYDGDETVDILWRHDSGAVYLWHIEDAGYVGSTAVGAAGPEWQIV